MHNPELIPKLHPYKLRFGQLPLTLFRDYRSAIKVELLNPEPKEQMMQRLYRFVRATWEDSVDDNLNPTKEQMEDGLNAMLSGQALGLGLEATQLTFAISGITRIDLQQIVRQRVGVVFSVQATGDRDLRHGSILVEESIAQDSTLLDNYTDSVLSCKNSYSKMVDSQIVSIQTARLVLPETREMHMYMNTNLSTFLFFYQKRIDDSSQTWQMNEIVRKMAEEVCKVYPELTNVIEKSKKKFTFSKDSESDRKNTFATALYIPKIDSYEYNDRDYLYNETKEAFNWTDTPIENTYYWGTSKITKTQYDSIASLYSQSSLTADETHLTNEEILQMNKTENEKIKDMII